MTYMNKADRRASIVDAAIEIILKETLGAATVRAVAKALDASPGHVHHHFASADELRAEALRTLWERASPAFERHLSELPPRRRLLSVLLGDTPDIEALTTKLWNDALIASEGEPLVRDAVRATMANWLELVVRTITEGVSNGDFAAVDKPKEVAAMLVAVSLGSDILMHVGVPAHAKEQSLARLFAFVDLILPPRGK